MPQRYRFSSKSQHLGVNKSRYSRCFWCHKGTDFQANHNCLVRAIGKISVVFDATKVQIFKQITTIWIKLVFIIMLFLMPQRYRFSSKSQQRITLPLPLISCFWCHKGTDFQANHNPTPTLIHNVRLFLMPQRYRFSSKSQRVDAWLFWTKCCFWCHKGTDFQANHN